MCFCMILRIPSLRSISDSCLNSLISHCLSFACSALTSIYLLAVVLSSDLSSDFLCIRWISSCSFSRVYFFSFKRIYLMCSLFSASFSFLSWISDTLASWTSTENFSSLFLSFTSFWNCWSCLTSFFASRGVSKISGLAMEGLADVLNSSRRLFCCAILCCCFSRKRWALIIPKCSFDSISIIY